MPDTLRKDDVTALLEDGSDYSDLFGFEDWTVDDKTNSVHPALSNV